MINFEAYEAKNGRPFTQEEKCFLDVVSLLNEAMRSLLALREAYLLAYLDGATPERLQELGKALVEVMDEVRVMQAYESEVYGIDFLRKT